MIRYLLLASILTLPLLPHIIITVGKTTWGPPVSTVTYYRVSWVMNDETGGSIRFTGYLDAVSELARLSVTPGVVWVDLLEE